MCCVCGRLIVVSEQGDYSLGEALSELWFADRFEFSSIDALDWERDLASGRRLPEAEVIAWRIDAPESVGHALIFVRERVGWLCPIIFYGIELPEPMRGFICTEVGKPEASAGPVWWLSPDLTEYLDAPAILGRIRAVMPKGWPAMYVLRESSPDAARERIYYVSDLQSLALRALHNFGPARQGAEDLAKYVRQLNTIEFVLRGRLEPALADRVDSLLAGQASSPSVIIDVLNDLLLAVRAARHP